MRFSIKFSIVYIVLNLLNVSGSIIKRFKKSILIKVYAYEGIIILVQESPIYKIKIINEIRN